MSRYNIPVAERVAAAQAIQNRVNGVAAVQESKSGLPSSDEFIAKNPDKFERLPSPGDCFLTDYLAVPYGP